MKPFREGLTFPASPEYNNGYRHCFISITLPRKVYRELRANYVANQLGWCQVIGAENFGAVWSADESVDRLVDAVEMFAPVWSGDTAEVAPHLTCTEVDALAQLLRAAGATESAVLWIEFHGRSDDDPDDLHCAVWEMFHSGSSPTPAHLGELEQRAREWSGDYVKGLVG